jgi:hypothetical protein
MITETWIDLVITQKHFGATVPFQLLNRLGRGSWDKVAKKLYETPTRTWCITKT